MKNLDDAVTSRLSEAKGSDAKLGDLEHALIVSDSANNDGNETILLLGEELVDLGDGDRRAIDAGHAEALEDDLVEGRVGAAREEAVELKAEWVRPGTGKDRRNL